MIRLWIIAYVLLAALPALAQQAKGPIAKVEVKPQTVTVGQPVRLRVTVLVPTWFRKPPVYPAFEIPNTSVRLPPDSSFPTNQRIGGNTWSGIIRDYQIYPQIAGAYRLTDQKIRVVYADPDTRNEVSATVAVPTIEFRGTVPPGAEGISPFFAARTVKLTQKIEGSLAQLAVGDAVVRTVTADVEGVPVMFVPPLTQDRSIDHVSRYAKEPIISEKGTGAALAGSRTETITYLFNKPGTYNLPATSLKWWNTAKSAPETSTVPAVTVTVAGAISSPVQDAGPIKKHIWFFAVIFVAAVPLFFAVRRFGPGVQSWIQTKHDAWRQSEAFAFRRLLVAVRQECTAAISAHLLEWLARLSPRTTASQLATVTGGGELDRYLKQLGPASFGRNASEEWLDALVRKRFVSVLKHARGKFKVQQDCVRKSPLLPPLNPARLETPT